MHTSYMVLLVTSLVGQPSDLPPFVKEHAKTVTFYYQTPDPALGPKLLRELLKKENLEHPWFAKNDYALLLNAALLGDIAAGNPKIVRAYEAAFTDAPPAGRRVIVRSLMNCGDPETLKRVDAWLADQRYADSRPELEALKKHLEDPGRKHVRDRPARDPDDLDLLWGNFFITGEYAPVARILDVLDLPDAQDNLVLKRVARWSLGSNMQQHPRLVKLVQEHARGRPEASRKVIDELIRTLQEVLGRWLSQDGDQEPLVFERDGAFQCGFVKEKGEWVMATGQYTITADGKITTKAEHGGSTLYQTFTLKDGVLTGSRGSKQNVEWKKDKP
ncbi:MAG TPA: hypothetical protein VG013_31190 [Gemmataceae bacterium]|nr:hypothetical protein [Gemmataceae bacterium]